MALSTEDRVAILELAARINDAASRRDVTAYLSYFTSDGILEGDMGTLVGQDALRQGLLPIWQREGPATLHLALNPLINDEGETTRLSYTLLMVQATVPQEIVGTAQVVEQLQKVEGHWLVTHHHVALPEEPPQK
jgi:ketosteroid isomerase-like protein